MPAADDSGPAGQGPPPAAAGAAGAVRSTRGPAAENIEELLSWLTVEKGRSANPVAA